MHRQAAFPALAAATLLLTGTAGPSLAASDAQLIKNAMSAAPKAVAKDATIMAMDDKMQMQTLRKGKNNFTCMPDNPKTPGNDPMCLDEGGMQWAKAWMGKTPPSAGVIGFGYMLRGGSDASNTDPHAEAPAAGAKWVDTGPHVMMLNVGDAAKTYPRQGENPNTREPYVMWPGTPWEHLMIPVR
jgi:hypothetical protein